MIKYTCIDTSIGNHSCLPNAEITFPYNNNIMAVVAKEQIATGQVCFNMLLVFFLTTIEENDYFQQTIVKEKDIFIRSHYDIATPRI